MTTGSFLLDTIIGVIISLGFGEIMCRIRDAGDKAGWP